MKLAAVASLLVLAAQPVWSACAEDKLTVIGDFGQVTFSIALADDPQERSQGLMFVEEMPTLAGMLFIYERPQSVSFWMKNTLIQLDMIFASADGEIQRIHENAIPGDLTPIAGGEDIQMVFEINGGLSSRLGIVAGDVMQHPSFGEDAILPCSKKTDS